MIRPSRTPLIIGSLVAAVFLIVNLVNTLNKGGDFDAYFAAGQRVLSSEALYAGSAIAYGFVGPPAQALLFAPIAPLGPLGSRLVWYAINVALLWYALATWLGVLAASHEALESEALTSETREAGRASAHAAPAGGAAAWRNGTRLFLSSWAFLPILAVAFPLQTQFEHQNLNVFLLALSAYAVDALARGRATAGGAALGVAAAIKVYPVIPLAWLALRQRWRAFGAGVAAALVATVAPIALRGIEGFLADVADWRALVGSGWPTRRANQSLVAMWGRYLLGEGPNGYPNLTIDQSWVIGLAALTALVTIVPLVRVIARVPASSPSSSWTLPEELACMHAVAVLVSPIAWEHYWVAFFPLLVALSLRARDKSAEWQTRWASVTFWIAFACFTVLSRPIVGWHGARLVRAWSLMTWAGVLTCVVLAVLIASRDRSRARASGH